MARPRLTFARERDAARLTALFANGSLLDDRRALDGHVALMLSDYSEARAAVVRQLNAAAIPVIGIPLMPYEDGYYFTVRERSAGAPRYAEDGLDDPASLAWDGVGLDSEPEARMFEQTLVNTWGLVPMLVRRLGRTEQAERARTLCRTKNHGHCRLRGAISADRASARLANGGGGARCLAAPFAPHVRRQVSRCPGTTSLRSRSGR